MKLLLDEMWSPAIAIQLQNRGYDVIAVAQRSDLRSESDGHIFAVAQSEHRAIVTDNVPDFHPYALRVLQDGGSHAGLIYTSNRRFSRHGPRTIGILVTALDELLSSNIDVANLEYWLP